MQTFLKILGFVTIFIGIISGIYVIADSMNAYQLAKVTNNVYYEQVYFIKLIAGGAIIVSSIVSGILYLSFGIVIELLDSINHRVIAFLESLKKSDKKDEFEEYTKF